MTKKNIIKRPMYFLLVSMGIIVSTVFLLGFLRIWGGSRPLSSVNVALVKGESISISKISSSTNSDQGGYKILIDGVTTGDTVKNTLIHFRLFKPGVFKLKTEAVMNDDHTFRVQYNLPEEAKSDLGWILTWSMKEGKVVAISTTTIAPIGTLAENK